MIGNYKPVDRKNLGIQYTYRSKTKSYCLMENKKFKLWPPIAILNHERAGEYIVKLFGITVYYRVTWK